MASERPGPVEIALLPDWPELSRAERSVLRLLEAGYLTYAELQRMRLAEEKPRVDDKRTLKRVDKELCSGISRLRKRGMIRRDSNGRYFLSTGTAVIQPLMQRHDITRAELLRYIASTRRRFESPDISPSLLQQLSEESAALDLKTLALLKNDWRDMRDHLVAFIHEGDRLYRRVPTLAKVPKSRADPTHRDLVVDELMTELDHLGTAGGKRRPKGASRAQTQCI
ncbi:MAG: hypothetical protein ACREDE_08040 [Thermoplasmata archaeon]